MTGFLYQVAFSTHIGQRRPNNEDAVGFHFPRKVDLLSTHGVLFIVADGVGGLEGGENASHQAVRGLIQEYYRTPPSNVEQQLVAAINKVNSDLFKRFEKSATTLVAAVIHGKQVSVAHVGDSLAYWYNNHDLQCLTDPHLVVPNISQPTKTKLERAVGYREAVKVDTTTGKLVEGSRLLLVTDGVTRYFDDRELSKELGIDNVHDRVRYFINESNIRGGKDNITALLVEIRGKYQNTTELLNYLNEMQTPRIDVARSIDDISPSTLTPRSPPIQDVTRSNDSLYDANAQTQISTTRSIEPQNADSDDLLVDIDSKLDKRIEDFAVPSGLPSHDRPESPAYIASPVDEQKKQSRGLGRSCVIGFILLLFLSILAGGIVLGITIFLASEGSEVSNSDVDTDTSTDNDDNEQVVTDIDSGSQDEGENGDETTNSLSTPEVDDISLDKLEEGADLQFATSAITYRAVDGETSAFVISTTRTYTLESIYTDRDNVTWYQLYDNDSDQSGWIRQEDTPEYEILP